MPRVTDAKCPVDEHFNFERRFIDGCGKILCGALTRDDHACESEIFQLVRHLCVVSRHLCAGMQLQRGDRAVDRGGSSKIGNNQGIHADLCRLARGIDKGGKLLVRDQCVERQIDLDTVRMCAQNGGAQCVSAEIMCIHSCVEG